MYEADIKGNIRHTIVDGMSHLSTVTDAASTYAHLTEARLE